MIVCMRVRQCVTVSDYVNEIARQSVHVSEAVYDTVSKRMSKTMCDYVRK